MHNLPIGAPSAYGRAGDELHKRGDDVPLVPLRKARAALLGMDLTAITVGTWALLVYGHAQIVPTGILALLAIAAGWWSASERLPLYAQAQLERRAGLCMSAITCFTSGSGILLVTALALNGPGSDPIATLAAAILLFALYAVTSRFAWWTILSSLLADGYCVERAIIVADSAAAARILAADIERRTAGRLRSAQCLGLLGSSGELDTAKIATLLDVRGATRVLVAAYDLEFDPKQVWLPALAALPACVTVIFRSGRLLHYGCSGRDLHNITWPEPPLGQAEQVIKRALDILIAVLALALLFPILAGIALCIRLDSPGPAIFRQKRVGENGRIFDMWKFRSMYDHLRDETAAKQTSRNDHRITRIGGLLRRTSLDELPQIINVLRGDMSIVGPRPHALGMTIDGQALDAVLPSYELRHRVKPGITGWAQVNGCRGELATTRAVKRRVALDCHYIDNWSIQLDARIILRTASLMLLDRHAY